MNNKQNPSKILNALTAIFVVLSLFATACGSNAADVVADTAETGEPEGATETEEPEGATETEEPEGATETGGTEGATEISFLCQPEVVGLQVGSLGDPLEVTTTTALHVANQTDCDTVANRNFDNPNAAAAIDEARRASFPTGVIANPAECVNPSSVGVENEPGQSVNPLGSAADDVEGVRYADGEVLALYMELELVTLASGDEVESEIATLGVGPSVPTLDPDFNPAVDTFTPNGVGTTVTRLRLNPPGDGVDGTLFDPLILSNRLAGQVTVQPNWVFTPAPGSHHSPANEPVPIHPLPTPTTNDKTGARVVILDGFGKPASPQDPMSLTSGHGTFVKGIIERLAPQAEVTQVDFADGAEFTTDWNVMRALGSLDAVAAVNFSAGAFTCPSVASAPLVDQAPLGMLVALEGLANQGTVVVAAAGNAGVTKSFFPAALAVQDTEADEHADGHPHTRANVGAHVIGVKALDAAGWIASFSNALPANAACALGVDVASDFPEGTYRYSYTAEETEVFEAKFTGAAVWSGTSFATPHITAGFVRLLAAGESVESAIDKLRNTCPED